MNGPLGRSTLKIVQKLEILVRERRKKYTSSKKVFSSSLQTKNCHCKLSFGHDQIIFEIRVVLSNCVLEILIKIQTYFRWTLSFSELCHFFGTLNIAASEEKNEAFDRKAFSYLFC